MAEGTPITVETERWRETVEKASNVTNLDLWDFSKYLLRSKHGESLGRASASEFVHPEFRYGIYFRLSYVVEQKRDDPAETRERIEIEYQKGALGEKYRMIKGSNGNVVIERARARLSEVYSPLAEEYVGEEYEEVKLSPQGRLNFLRNLWETSQSVDIPVPSLVVTSQA